MDTRTVDVPPYEVAPAAQVEAETSAVIVVDMQNDFADPGGKLFGPRAHDIIPAVQRLLSKAHAKRMTVIYTQDWHTPDDPEFAIWGEHCVAGSWGAQIVDDLPQADGDITIRKTTYDAFYGTPLESLLRTNNIQTVIVTGTVANICVLHTAASAALRGLQVVVPLDAVAPLTDFDLETLARQVDFLYQGTLVDSDAITVS